MNAINSFGTPLPPATKPVMMANACRVFGVEMGDLEGRCRLYNVALARMAVYYLLRKQRRLSFLQIGILMKRDHSTIISGVARIEKMMKEDRSLRLQVLRCGR